MNEFHPYPPYIPCVANDVVRPLWSVMIPTYNCANYLRETLTSVLAQDPGPDIMQIMVVDDHSKKDDPEAVVREIGRGRVEFHRQPQNVGMTKNYETCLKLSRGHLIHQLHGDDYVKQGFYEKLQKAFEQHPQIGAAFCQTVFIDAQGNQQKITALERSTNGILGQQWLERIAEICCIPTPSIIVRRKVYEQLGGFDHRFRCAAEDWEMWARIAANYPIWFEAEPLAVYRRHSRSNTGRNIINGIFADDLVRAIEMMEGYLADKVPNAVFNQARRNCSFHSLETAEQLMISGDFFRAIARIRSALSYSFSFKVIRSSGRILLLNGTCSLLFRPWFAKSQADSQTPPAKPVA